MSPNLLQPRRLRESPQGPSSVEGRLARQLRILSVHAAMPQLRRYSALPRRRRYILTTVRIAALATVVLAVSGVATATAAYVVHRMWPGPATVETPPASQRTPQARRPHATESRVRPVEARPPAPELGVATVTSATPSCEHPASMPPHPSRSVAAMHSGSLATRPRWPPVEPPAKATPTPAATVEPLALPSPALPTVSRTPPPSGSRRRATS